MTPILSYIADHIIGQRIHFKCDCALAIDFVGRVVDYEIHGSEILFLVDKDGKIVKIGSNHPNLTVEPA